MMAAHNFDKIRATSITHMHIYICIQSTYTSQIQEHPSSFYSQTTAHIYIWPIVRQIDIQSK